MLSLILLVLSSFFLFDYFYLLFLFVFCFLYVAGFFNCSYLVSYVYKFSSVCLTDYGYYFVLLVLLLFISLFVFGHFSFFLFLLLVLILFVFLQFFFSVNTLYMLLYFEFSFVVIYLLIVFWGYNPKRLESLSYFLIYSVCGSFPIFGVVSVFVYYVGSSFCFDCCSQLLLFTSFCLPSTYSLFCFFYSLVIVLGFFFKFPVWGFHSWLPKAHVEAPYYGSVLLAGLMVKLGLYGVLYFYSYFLYFSFSFSLLCWLVSYLGFSFIFSNLSTVRQYDLKSYIAYSSIVHMGLVSISFWSGSVVSTLGSVILSISHGLISSLLFIGSNFFYLCSGTRSLYINRGYLYFYSLFIFFWFLVLVFNSSVPFSFGFFSELSLFYSIVNFLFSNSFFICFNLFFCGFYCIYLYMITSHGCSNVGLYTGFYSSFLLYLVFLFLVLFNFCFGFFLMFFVSLS
uniref:NADH-ubiquinone oxidoreductase chain 4 n=1 Tax=Dugesia ryukyuensis TaxID=79738 RepID=G9M8W1_DUGRY|nr:NADH dehydrogenase subunit 4 [Dugesia ryukyuensis]